MECFDEIEKQQKKEVKEEKFSDNNYP